MKKGLKKIEGWPSWRIRGSNVEAWVTETGGHLAPVVFDRKGRQIQPFSIAPWSGDPVEDQPKILQVLRGDFFCMPFGGNDATYRGEQHPVHGETANRKWKLVGLKEKKDQHTLHLRMKTKVRAGQVDKYITLVDGQNAVYSRHIISGMSGPMPLGHHATLKFPDQPGSGLISCSRFIHGQVFVEPTENPEARGYSMLKPGAPFKNLGQVPTIAGDTTDLSSYPARRGFEDIAILVSDPKLQLAWTAVAFPEEGYVWFALKDPSVLVSTLLWMSNGGRHYWPWCGRHVNVLGLEEITGFFHLGLKESHGKNALNARGIKTAMTLSKKKPTTVNYIMACVPAPRGFGRVEKIQPTQNRQMVQLTAEGGQTLDVPVHVDFLKG